MDYDGSETADFIDELREEILRLRAALGIYADETNWSEYQFNDFALGYEEPWALAQEALKHG